MNQEIVPYTESQRDRLERRLAEEANKIDLLERRNGGMTTIYYRLLKECINIIYLEDERTGFKGQFECADDEIRESFEHSWSDPRINITPYRQNQNQEGYGA